MKVSFLLIGVLLSMACLGQSMSDFYKIETLHIPEEIELEAGGVAFNDQGQIGVCTRRGEVWLVSNPKSPKPDYKLIAHGLHEALGINYRNGVWYVTQRSEITKLIDLDGDQVADRYEQLAGWPLSGNYHEYSYGPDFLPNGDMIVTLNVAWHGGGKSFVKWRGWMLRITPQGEIFPHAAGFRSPAGFGVNDQGDIFYAENQGDWVGSGRVTHVERGDFVGHTASLDWTDEPESPLRLKPENIQPHSGLTMYQYAKLVPEIKPPSVWFPHGLMGVSTSDIKQIPEGFGPYTGQMLVGDQGHSKIMRMEQEKVNGVYQGACFPFVNGFSSGVLHFRFNQNNELYVGQTARGWWAIGGELFALERLKWTGKTPFDIKGIYAKPDGFEIEFTKPVNAEQAADISSYQIADFTYKYHQTYGSPVIEHEKRSINHVIVSEDARKVRVYLDKLRRGFIYEVKTQGITAANGEKLVNDFGFYTLNEIPKGSKAVFASRKSETTTGAKSVSKRKTVLPDGWDANALTNLEISTVPGLKFDKTLLTVKRGAKVRLTFVNPDDMLHNFVLVKPGTADDVVQQALNLGLNGQEMSYVPNSDAVLTHTNLLQPESSETIYFEAPSQPGNYTFVCTFPGHGPVMRGTFKVE